MGSSQSFMHIGVRCEGSMGVIKVESCAPALRGESNSLLEELMSFSTKVDDKLKVLEEKEKCLRLMGKQVDEKLKRLAEKESRHNTNVARVTANKSASKKKVRLNVGGCLFTASKETFVRWEGTYFHTLLNSECWNLDEDGEYFIDRDPKLFDRIMASLRSGAPIDRTGLSAQQVEHMNEEIAYYQLPAEASGCPMTWDSGRGCGNVAISADGRTVTVTQSDLGAHTVLATIPDAPCFQVRFHSLGMDGGFAIGYQKEAINTDGWYLSGDGILCHMSNGYETFSSKYCEGLFPGDVVKAQYDKAASTITFTVNGKNHGIAFRDVHSGNDALYPFIDFDKVGSSASLEDVLTSPLQRRKSDQDKS